MVAAQNSGDRRISILVAFQHGADIAGDSIAQDLVRKRPLRNEREPAWQRRPVLSALQRNLEFVFIEMDDLARRREHLGDQHIAAKAHLEILGRKAKRVDDRLFLR